MQHNEIMCGEYFDRIVNVRLVEKCCANCKHGEWVAACKKEKNNE